MEAGGREGGAEGREGGAEGREGGAEGQGGGAEGQGGGAEGQGGEAGGQGGEAGGQGGRGLACRHALSVALLLSWAGVRRHQGGSFVWLSFGGPRFLPVLAYPAILSSLTA